MTLDQVESNLGRPLRADAERNRRRILAAAAEVFARRGLEAGLDEIARHAGVGTGTVYRRFPDKTMLIEALFESRLDDLVDLLERCAQLPDPWDGLVQFLYSAVEMQQADRGLKDLLFQQNCDISTDRFADKRQKFVPRIRALLTRAKEAGALRPDVDVTDLAMMQFTLHSVGALAQDVQPEIWRRQLAIFLDGLRADAPGRVNSPLPVEPVSEAQFEEMCRKHTSG